MEISQKKINKLLAIQSLMNKGDEAVIEKLLEFQDIIDDIMETFGPKLSVIEKDMVDKLEALKQEFADYVMSKDSELSTKLAEYSDMPNKLSEMNDMMTESSDNHEKMCADMENLSMKCDNLVKEIQDIKESLPEEVDLTDLNDKVSTLEAKSEEIKTLIPKLDSPIELRDKLESIDTENEKLSIEAIRNLRKELDDLKKEFKSTRGGGFSIIGGKQLRAARFTFTGDSSTTEFYLPKEPAMDGLAIWAYYQGQYLHLGTHYTVKNRTFTCVGFTPQTGSYIEGFIII